MVKTGGWGNAGSPLTFTFAYANNATIPLTSATITSTLPAGVTYVSCTGGAACQHNSGALSWTLGDLPGGATGSVSVTITLPNTWTSASMGASATLSALAPDASIVTETAAASVAVSDYLVTTPTAFTFTKTASATQIAPAGTVTYTLNYHNYGGTPATGVVITDTLPGGMTFSSATGGGSHSLGVVTWAIGNVAAGASGSVTVTVTAAAAPFTFVNPTVNRASLNWTGGAPVSSNDAAVGITGQTCSTYYFKSTDITIGASTYQRATTTAPTGSASSIPFLASNANGYVEFARFYQDPATSATVSFNGNITTYFYVTKSNGPVLRIHGYVYDYDPATGTETLLGSTSTPFSDNGNSTNTLYSFTIPVSGSLAKGHRLSWRFLASSNNSISFNYLYDGTASPTRAEYCVTPPASLSTTVSVNTASVTAGATPNLVYTIGYATTEFLTPQIPVWWVRSPMA